MPLLLLSSSLQQAVPDLLFLCCFIINRQNDDLYQQKINVRNQINNKQLVFCNLNNPHSLTGEQSFKCLHQLDYLMN